MMDLKKTAEEVGKITQEMTRKLFDAVMYSNQILLIGNGGSNAIASHIAVDYIKFLKKRSLSFSDAPMITAYMNDYSVEMAYANFVNDHLQDNTLVILISSSGNSDNVVKAAEYCDSYGVDYIILTGFEPDNKLRANHADNAIIDYWIDSNSYGVVECVHQIFLHSIIDN